MSYNFVTAIERIQQIDWTIDAEYKKSNDLLVSEFLRRASEFLTYSSSTSSSLFFSPIKVLGINIDLDLEELSEQLFPEQDIPSNPITRIICLRYIELAYLLERGVTTAIKFQDIYEPIIRFLERGGSLRIDKGVYLETGGFTFLLGEWVERYSKDESIDISDSYLNYVDGLT
ncbi:hypothetical protein PAECIP112173_04183 [Paenibacillus sp. JJ-100]|uniref:hypothetical protein n=1 Tax=Paenibacillus sp. JJ-100 TaxID=2974896 RepID=UPI0022FFB2B4|nr:hypothetical protein [Paenibacillus sp. JJ-100]CAI6084113.1 hypothetical protein PAECIP112173_04183 [Paenibacillus sp. JJ-100]